MKELIAELERAEEGSREFDAGAAQAQGFDTLRGEMCVDGRWIEIPDYTTNLQDALGLVPEDMSWEVRSNGKQARAGVYPITLKRIEDGATPALALTIAALKARQEET